MHDRNRTCSRRVPERLTILGTSMLFVAAACGEGDATSSCGAQLAAKVDAVSDAAVALQTSVNGIRADVLTACRSIAQDLGASVPAQGSMTDDQYVQMTCALAKGEIDAEVRANVMIVIAAEPPRCTIDAQAQLSCEAQCNVSGTCDPGSIEVRCQPGELSVVCEGMCQANAWCEAEANATVACNGRCQGVCMGQCAGGTMDAAGECSGTCMGQCRGSCQVTASGGANCGAMARCKGGCSGTARAPECRGELKPPACDIDAECEAGCKSQASFKADCEPGRLTVAVQGGASVNLKSTLEKNLPVLISVAQGVGGFFTSAASFATTGASVLVEVGGIAACAAATAADLTAALAASASASVSISVSVQASASVTASAGG